MYMSLAIDKVGKFFKTKVLVRKKIYKQLIFETSRLKNYFETSRSVLKIAHPKDSAISVY